MKATEWTSQAPTEPGFYWMKYGPGKEKWNASQWLPDVILIDGCECVWVRGSEESYPVSDLPDPTLLFAGPIFPPEGP